MSQELHTRLEVFQKLLELGSLPDPELYLCIRLDALSREYFIPEELETEVGQVFRQLATKSGGLSAIQVPRDLLLGWFDTDTTYAIRECYRVGVLTELIRQEVEQ